MFTNTLPRHLEAYRFFLTHPSFSVSSLTEPGYWIYIIASHSQTPTYIGATITETSTIAARQLSHVSELRNLSKRDVFNCTIRHQGFHRFFIAPITPVLSHVLRIERFFIRFYNPSLNTQHKHSFLEERSTLRCSIISNAPPSFPSTGDIFPMVTTFSIVSLSGTSDQPFTVYTSHSLSTLFM